jgi:hypothetical protein
VKEAKLFFDYMSPLLITKRKQLTPANFVSLLYCASKYNLIDVYDLHPLYVEFLFNFEEKKFRSEIKNNLPKILFTLANFALRTKEFNPLFKEMALNLPQYLKENFSSSNSENLEDILLSIAVIELCMKYNLTDIDFGKYFSAELLTSLINLQLLKMKNEENVKKFMDNFGINKIKYDYTNLQIFNVILYKDYTMPAILINDSDYNLNGKYSSSVYIRYNHLNSYLEKPPMVINVDRVKPQDDLEKEVFLYLKNSQGVYKNHLI